MKPQEKEIKKFALTLFVGFFVLGLILYLKRKPGYINLWGLAVTLISLRFIFPLALIPIYKIWMKLAHILGWINTRIILCFIFYLIFTPLGLAMKLFGVDLLDRRIEKGKLSYWKEKDKVMFNPSTYERQF